MKSENVPCGCTGGAGATTVAGETAADQADDRIAKVLRAQVPQSYEASFNVRVVPARSLADALVERPGCKPRGHRKGWGPLTAGLAQELTPALADKLARADKTVMAWLARDKANAQRFLAQPLQALAEAGVELERSEHKALARAQAAAAATQMVPPGVTVTSVAAEAVPNGRVGGIARPKPGAGAEAVPDCGPRRKG
jgi:hypothetical protein